jgi:hypothetical protein
MAAPTNGCKREESSCQPGAVHTWPKADIGVGYDRSGSKATTRGKITLILVNVPRLRGDFD